jgi:hypothetical protein
MRPTSHSHPQLLAWFLLFLLGMAALPWQVFADDQPILPGHKVTAFIKSKWVDATVVEVRPHNSFLVSEAWSHWADEIYPYTAVQVNNATNPDPQSLKPGMAIKVVWGSTFYPARVVKIGPTSLVVRWESSTAQTHELTIAQVRAIPQPEPKPGKSNPATPKPPADNATTQPEQTIRGPKPAIPKPPAPPVILRGSRLYRTSPIDYKNIQFLDTSNTPLSGLTLSAASKDSTIATDTNGDVSLSRFSANPWYEITLDNQTFRILTDHPWFKRTANIAAPLPIGPTQSNQLVEASVQVLLPDGQPATNAWVYVQTLRRGTINENWSWLRIKTNDLGRVTFKMLPTAEAQLARIPTVEYIDLIAELDPSSFPPSGNATQPSEVSTGSPQTHLAPAFAHCLMSEKLEIRFVAGKPRSLALTDKTGQPLSPDQLANVKVLIQKPHLEKPEFIPVAWQSQKPFPFPDGQYRVDFPSNPSRYFTVRAGQSPDLIPISFKPEFRISGRVLTPAGEPAPGVSVLLLNAYGPRFNPDKLTPEAWATLEKTRPQSGALNPQPIPLNLTDESAYTPDAIAWTDAHGRYTIETDAKGPVAVAGRTLALHQVMPDFPASRVHDLYAIPCGTLTFTPKAHSDQIKLSSVGIELNYDDATPAAIRNLDPASISIFSRYSAQGPIQLRIPAGYPVSFKLIGPSSTMEYPAITLTPGQVVDRGSLILPDPAGRTLAFTVTDANRTPIPQAKVTLVAPGFNTSLPTDRKGFAILSLPDNVNRDALVATFQAPHLSSSRTRLTHLPSLDDPEGTTLTALFPQTLCSLAAPDPIMTDAAGKPLPNAPVQVDGFLGSKLLATDAAGALSAAQAMSVLPFRITVTAPDKRRYAWSPDTGSGLRTLPIPVPENKTLPLIRGRVLLPTGKPAANCLVGAHSTTLPPGARDLVSAYPTATGVYTDQDGAFVLSPTWNDQISPLSTPPQNWVVVAQGDSQRKLGITAALWNITNGAPTGSQGTAAGFTLTLPETQPVDITMSLPANVSYNISQKNPAYLARIDPQTGTRLMITPLRPGLQPSSLALSPGRYIVFNQLACSAPIDLPLGATTLSCGYPTSQLFRFTVVDVETQKPIPSALLGTQLRFDILPYMDDKGWETTVKNQLTYRPSEAYPSLATNELGECEKTVTDANNDPSFLMLQVCAFGYIPTQISNLPLLASPNAQGIKEIRIALQPAYALRLVTDRNPMNRVNPPRRDQPLTVRVITSPPAGITGEQVLTATTIMLEGAVLVPRSRPFWLVARDRHVPASDVAGIATPTPDVLWLTPDPLTLTPTSSLRLALPQTPTVPVQFKVVDPSGAPVAGMNIAPSLKHSGAGLFQAVTDSQGIARLNLPLGFTVDMKLAHPAFPAPLTNPAWTTTVSDPPTAPNPVILKLQEPIPPSQ